ncbi:MAG TPA: 5-oxoprolinase subunit PxpA, partial [Thermodesulfobacteriota bacterium]|nr:5-oxoprolinase subunit PxpA [Thermodesulfobacteriota bacterium]
GESFGRWKLGFDEELMEYISSANIACGFHAGDPLVMRNTVWLCKKHGVKVGTHVGFPDLVGFGRRLMALSPEEYLYDSLYQGGALQAIARSEGEALQHFTWHGSAGMSFYGDSEELARAGAQAVAMLDKRIIVPVIHGARGDLMAREAEKLGLKVARKFFADRALEDNGALVNRKKPGAVIKDPEVCADRVIQMVQEGKVKSYTGKDVAVYGHTIMVHGDTETAVNVARTIRKKLEAAGIQIAPMSELV